jgi:succinate dehydrogenase/fumarate reductase flavoprotein subunit
VLIGI